MKVYLVKLDWSTEDSNDIELFVCGTYDKAYEKFKELIANEMNPDNSWVGELEWENGVPKDDKIELDFLDRRSDNRYLGLRRPYLHLYRNQGGLMKPFKTQAHIHSLDGQMDEITVLEELGNNSYLVDYRGVKCSAIFNPFNSTYYADDIYGIIKEKTNNG